MIKIVVAGLFPVIHAAANPTSTPSKQRAIQCRVSAFVQRYEAATLKLISFEAVRTDAFDVSPLPHEPAKSISVSGARGPVGVADVWTGTLADQENGEVIQAHASFTIEGVSGRASLVMAVASPMAKSIVEKSKEVGSEMVVIPVELKCQSN
jgi:hypothetical protein